MLLKLVVIGMLATLAIVGAAPSPYPPGYVLPAHSYSSVVHYPSYAYKYPYVLPLSSYYNPYKYYGGYGYPGLSYSGLSYPYYHY